MHTKLLSAVANSGLLVMVLVLLAGPLLMGQLLSTSQSGALGLASVRPPQTSSSAGVQADFMVAPNVADFKNYAQFSSQPTVSDHFYQTSVAFSAFGGQLAAYNGLMTITNSSAKALKLEVEVGKLSGALPQSKIYVTLTTPGTGDSALLTQGAQPGSNTLMVSQTKDFSGGQVVVDGQVVKAKAEGVSVIGLLSPLAKPVNVGDKIYFNPAFFAGDVDPVLPNTQTLTVAPGQKAIINLAVATDVGAPATVQAELPLSIVEK